MKQIYDDISFDISSTITKTYSTSFSLGIKLLHKKLRPAIYAIYGFVRVADEIVDSFHDCKQEEILARFKKETYLAIEEKISTNIVLHSFQQTVNEYNIDLDLIETFFKSMEMDLNNSLKYDQELYDEYILGSAQVVGLMCLKVFCYGVEEDYERLKPPAMSLGSAFQKVNFLRDAHYDYKTLDRVYFPNIDFEKASQDDFNAIFDDTQADFNAALLGIKQLPDSSKFGVYMAYRYYTKLFLKIQKVSAKQFVNHRVRVNDTHKFFIFIRSLVRHKISYY